MTDKPTIDQINHLRAAYAPQILAYFNKNLSEVTNEEVDRWAYLAHVAGRSPEPQASRPATTAPFAGGEPFSPSSPPASPVPTPAAPAASAPKGEKTAARGANGGSTPKEKEIHKRCDFCGQIHDDPMPPWMKKILERGPIPTSKDDGTRERVSARLRSELGRDPTRLELVIELAKERLEQMGHKVEQGLPKTEGATTHGRVFVPLHIHASGADLDDGPWGRRQGVPLTGLFETFGIPEP